MRRCTTSCSCHRRYYRLYGATTTAGAATAVIAAATATTATGKTSQRCPPRGSRHFLPDGGSVQARWTTHELYSQSFASRQRGWRKNVLMALGGSCWSSHEQGWSSSFE